MIKRVLFILSAILSLALGSCSHNNGGDSTFWGTWKLTSIVIDGKDDTGYPGNYFWKFQGEVVVIQEIDDFMHERIDHVGTWSYLPDEGLLLLDFSHSDDANPAGTGPYAPPTGIYITEPLTSLKLLSASGSNLVLSHSTDDNTITYYLEKW